MKKDLAGKSVVSYPLGMETTTAPTADPHLKAAYTAAPLETTTKTTEGKVVTCYYAKEKIECKYAYGQVIVYQIGDQINGTHDERGLAQIDGYNCLACDIIPWDKIITRKFIIVREYKTTTWEILNK
jgi:hypothetical protein